MIRKFALLTILCITSMGALAAEVAGVKLDDKMTVGGQELVLNGAGIRTKLMFKVYVGSLYVPAKATSAGAVYAKAPRRVQLNMLRDVTARPDGRGARRRREPGQLRRPKRRR